MDLVTYALAKKYTDSKITGPAEAIVPTIGDNGNWFIKGIDTGFRATPIENVEVDGILKADVENQQVVVVKDGTQTIIGDFTNGIGTDKIEVLFE